eukprot:CAMPEP_0206500452 /NCGR_PEP_ID=MMETSP0324_2-20121206/52470_1 /ASSEMBLY_ACC=CAM_ASM_000836 /TAXON_ID=2866 /ORGANISM="Crypthecodinium cohnii, Strain Seligo" /LENGTH=101 /DNA_ID=CAMNT_0053987577 /DNA_START=237 /DNA_END=542 /DNA_ORIENTATION=-
MSTSSSNDVKGISNTMDADFSCGSHYSNMQSLSSMGSSESASSRRARRLSCRSQQKMESAMSLPGEGPLAFRTKDRRSCVPSRSFSQMDIDPSLMDRRVSL